jgi:hypothetical protein
MTPRLRVTRPSLGAGVFWLQGGVALLRQGFVAWLGLSSAVLLALLLLGMTGAGAILASFLGPFVVALFMLAGDASRRAERFSFLVLPGQLRPTVSPLFQVGLVNALATLAASQLILVMAGSDLETILTLVDAAGTTGGSANPEVLNQHLERVMPALWTALLIVLPVSMASWFAPALILFDAFSAGRALWWSLWTVLTNVVPMLLFALLLGGGWLLALIIPYGIGFMLFLPLLMAATYVGYRSIFHSAEASSDK